MDNGERKKEKDGIKIKRIPRERQKKDRKNDRRKERQKQRKKRRKKKEKKETIIRK